MSTPSDSHGNLGKEQVQKLLDYWTKLILAEESFNKLKDHLQHNFELIDYQEFSKTEEWERTFGNALLEDLTQKMIKRMTK